MAKFEKKLQEVGLTYETVSAGLRGKIDEFRENEKVVKSIKTKLSESGISDDERDELATDLNDLLEILEAEDTKLVGAVEKYNKNKDVYAQLGKNLKGRPKKTQGETKAQPKAEEKTQPEQKPQPQPEPQPQPQSNTKDYSGGGATEEKEEKKGGATGWILGGLLLVLSAGMIYKFSKK